MAVTTELLLARHGEAACNVAGTVGGDQGCTVLTPLGRRQVERLAARLTREHADRPLNVLYTTPRRRVQETAEIVTRTLGLPAVVEADLRGPDHGDADGRPWQEVKAAFGGPPQHNPDQPYSSGSESWNAYLDRATCVLEKIIIRHEGQRVLVLAHGETIEAAHTLLLSLQPTSKTRSWPATGRYPIWTDRSSSTAPTWTTSPPPCAPPAVTCWPSLRRSRRSRS